MIPTIMTQIIGTAVTLPPELASGAATDIATARATPRTAEAAPATFRAWSAASARIAEDERLNGHQDQKPGTGEQ